MLAGALAIIGAGLLATLSRGAWLGAFCGVGVLLMLRRQFGVFFRAGLVLIPVILIAWQFLPKESRETATGFDRSTHRNIEARFQTIEIARGYFDQDPVLGMGVGLRKEFDATNLLWVTLAETGVLGAGALILIHVAFFRMAWRVQKWTAREDELFTVLALGVGSGHRSVGARACGSLLDSGCDDARVGRRGDGDFRLLGSEAAAGGRRRRTRKRKRTRDEKRRHATTP